MTHQYSVAWTENTYITITFLAAEIEHGDLIPL